MSDVLARIRVRETAGIRRFLYPLAATVELPTGIDSTSLGWSGSRGDAVPLQILPVSDREHRLDFALSLAPMEERTFELTAGGFRFPIPDSLHVEAAPDGDLHSRQERVSFDILRDGSIHQVTYDGLSHLRETSRVINMIYAGSATPVIKATRSEIGPLTTRLTTEGTHTLDHMTREGRTVQIRKMPFKTTTEITACKSWIKKTFSSEASSGWIIFDLNFSTSSMPLLCDFGIGGGIYGKMTAAANLALYVEEVKDDVRQWKIFVTDENGRHVREECRGCTSTPWQSEMWFHLIDADKSLAVALTQVPAASEINIRLTASGHTSIEFIGNGNGPSEFGVCYHFLNNVPAIAAATNPQSILLPPIVEVLPV